MTLRTYDVYQQFPPIRLGEKDENGEDLYAINLLRVGQVDARDGAEALNTVRQWTRFRLRSRSTLMRYPIVEDAEHVTRSERAPDEWPSPNDLVC